MTKYQCNGAIPGLLRRGSPVTKTWQGDEDEFTAKGVVLERLEDDAAGERWSCWFFDERINRDTGFPPDLDLTDPTGRYHALLWLRERGHDLRWAEDEPEVLAWSVLSVSRGAPPLKFILPQWTTPPEYYGMSAARCLKHYSDWLHVKDEPFCRIGWEFWPYGLRGPETGAEGRAAADRAALSAGYALRNDDGTLTLPELPEVTRG